MKEDHSPAGWGAWPYTIQMIGARHILDNHPDKKSAILDRDHLIIPRYGWNSTWSRFQSPPEHDYTLGSQEKWVEILEEWISTEFSDSRRRLQLLLRDMDPEVRIRVLYKLKEKEYYDEIYEMAIRGLGLMRNLPHCDQRNPLKSRISTPQCRKDLRKTSSLIIFLKH